MSGIIARLFRPVQAVVMPQHNNSATAVPVAGESAAIADTANESAPDPLAELQKVMQNDPNVKPQADPLAAPILNTDVTKLRQAASQMDLTGTVDPELLAKAMSGNDPAAFLKVLNTVATTAVATSAQLTASTVEQATTRNNDRLKQVIPTQIKQAQIASGEGVENPALAHPAAAPFLDLVRSQIQMKNPGLSPVEINKQAEAVISNFATAVHAAPEAVKSQQQQAQGTDWDAWAGISGETS